MKTKYCESIEKVIKATSKDFSPNDKLLQDLLKTFMKIYNNAIKPSKGE
jgi:hypothetical protein